MAGTSLIISPNSLVQFMKLRGTLLTGELDCVAATRFGRDGVSPSCYEIEGEYIT